MYQTCDNQIWQSPEESAAHKTDERIYLPLRQNCWRPRKDPAEAPAGSISEITVPTPMDISAGNWWFSAEERVKRIENGSCFYCGGFNHSKVKCVARKMAQIFNTAGAYVREVETNSSYNESVNDDVSWAKMVLRLVDNVAVGMLENILELRVYHVARWRFRNTQWRGTN